MVNPASRWVPAEYARHGGFVPELGLEVVRLLAPRTGELVLDVGCGDGVLTARIAEAGARVIGLDSSPEMVEAARARGIDAFVADAQALDLSGQAERFGQFDAAFSNAALHWMLDPDAVASGLFALLKTGGRFVGEMGADGNLAVLRAALRSELVERGFPMPGEDPAWYPDVEQFSRLFATAGFSRIEARAFSRPTALPAGVAGWVRTFRAGMLDVAMVPEWQRDEIAAAVEARVAARLRQPDGTWLADYVRLRFAMWKPE